MIDPDAIPQFTGNLDQLETDASDLKSDASAIAKTGADVHSSFQGLSAFYDAPEAEQLFATTKPVADTAKTFGDDLKWVAAALSQYAHEVRPIAQKLKDLKAQAATFVASTHGHDDWQYDHDKVARDNELRHEVDVAVAAFWDAERRCANKIEAIFCGTPFVPDDGSHKPNMYGFSAALLDGAKGLPWGDAVEQKHHWYEIGYWTKSFVWDGLIVDGVWGTLKGLGGLFGLEGLDTLVKSWKGLGELGIGLASYGFPNLLPIGLAIPDSALPKWVQDGRKATREVGKSMLAWDEWSKNPARAAGGVTFNALTMIAGGEGAAASAAGDAGKAGAAARVIGLASKAGSIIDPMTYIGKGLAMGAARLPKVSELAAAISNLKGGVDVKGLDDLTKIHGVELPDGSLKFPDGSVLHPSGDLHLPDGTVKALSPGELASVHVGHDLPRSTLDMGPHTASDASHGALTSTDHAAGHSPVDAGTHHGAHDVTLTGHDLAVAHSGDGGGIHEANPEQGKILPDGSWEGPNGLELSPEANAATNHFLERAVSTEPHITDAVKSIAHNVDHGKLNGLEYRLKGEDSLKRKIATAMLDDPALTPQHALADIKDSLRYTLEIPSGDYSHAVQQAVDDLHARGFENVTFKNTWESSGYKGINSTWRDPITGQVFELQFHTPESFTAKMDTHVLYEKERLPGVSAEELQAIRAEQKELFGRVPIPSHVETIHLGETGHDLAAPTAHDGSPTSPGNDHAGPGAHGDHPDTLDSGIHHGDNGSAEHGDGNAVADRLENRGTPTPTPQTHRLGSGHPGFSIMDKGDQFYRNALNAKPLEGHYDVVAHGTMHNTLMDTAGGRELSPRELADIIRRRADYKPGTPIRLISCNTGHTEGTFAGQLARDLGVPVVAPDGYAYTDVWGNLGVDRELNLLPRHVPSLPGSFYRFHPGGFVEKLPRSEWAVDQ